MALSLTDELPEMSEVFVEDDCPGFHRAEYEAGKFQEFADMVTENNCALWLQNGEVTTDGHSRVDFWRDMGPHGFHAEQDNASVRPNLTDDGIGDVLQFNATQPDSGDNDGDYLRLNRDVDDLDLDEDAGIGVAAIIKGDEFDRNGVWMIGEAGATGQEFSLRTCSNRSKDGCEHSDPEGWWRAQNWNDSDVDFQSGNASAEEWLVIIQAYDGEDVIIRVNGEEVARESRNLDLSTNRDIQLGRWERDDDEYWYFQGAIAEPLIFVPARDEDDIEILEGYFESQYSGEIELNGPIED